MWSCSKPVSVSPRWKFCVDNHTVNTVHPGTDDWLMPSLKWTSQSRRRSAKWAFPPLAFQRAEQWMVYKLVRVFLLQQLCLLPSLLMETLMWEQVRGRETFNDGKRHCNSEEQPVHDALNSELRPKTRQSVVITRRLCFPNCLQHHLRPER